MYDFEAGVARIAEAKIREDMENGEFDNLPGQGKPLEVEDLSLVPEELRTGYILLKSAGFLPRSCKSAKRSSTWKGSSNAASAMRKESGC